MEKSVERIKLTVQGVNNPVPAAVGGDHAGSRSSRSCDWNGNKNNNINQNENDMAAVNGSTAMKATPMTNPFGRSSLMARTPPNSSNGGLAHDGLNVKANQPKSSMSKLGEKINVLVEFVKGRTNVHKEIVSITREIQAMFLNASEELATGDKTQKQNQTPKGPVSSLSQTPKRTRDSTTGASPKGNRSKKKKVDNPNKLTVVHNVANVETITPVPPSNGASTSGVVPEWTRVRAKARKRKKQQPIRPDALVIKEVGGLSYADILRKVKSEPKLDVLGQNVKKIRRTAKGELLFELNKSAHQNTGEFKQNIEEVLGSQAQVRVLTHETYIEIKDIEETTGKDEIHRDLIKAFPELKSLHVTAIKSVRKAYDGTQTATLALNAALARPLIKATKVRIEWSICRIREKKIPRKCLRCFDFGHLASKCNSVHDYSGKCLRCGMEGHKAKTCKNMPKCLLCKDTIKSHSTGDKNCPRYREAVQKMK